MRFRSLLGLMLIPCAAVAQDAAPKFRTEPPVGYAPAPAAPLTQYPAYQKGQFLRFVPGRSTPRVDLNLRNATLKEAIKQLKEQTGREFILDTEFWNKKSGPEPRVTVIAKSIRLSTALDLLTEASGMGWSEISAPAAAGKPSKSVYHLGASLSPEADLGTSYRWSSSLNPYILFAPQWSTPTPGKPGASRSYKATPPQGRPLLGPGRLTLPVPSLPETTLDKIYSIDGTLFRTDRLAEVRSTFTCPHCKQQVTVIRQHVSPKCAKCGRVFHDDWQFCPFDGAARPAAGADWLFCPICGKSVRESEAQHKAGL